MSDEQGHIVKRTLVEIVDVPPHMPRRATEAYRTVHHQMIVVEDRPCLACGVRNSTLADPGENPHGATAIETHHHIIEWSLANCIDLDKFNHRIVARLRAEGKAGYDHDFSEREMLDWIDHSPDNLWPLCTACHRSVHRGIHWITMPIWSALDLVKDGYRLVPTNEEQP